MTCRTFVQFLDEYASGEMPADIRAAFDGHVAGCAACRHYLHGYLTAGEMLRAALCEDDDLPEDVPPELVEAILAVVATSDRRPEGRSGARGEGGT